jgi:DNA (cytosine-5)-methyltransferase 1
MLTHFDAFGGIGAFSEACRRTGKISTVAYCDIDKAAQQVYADNFPDVPIYSDIQDYHPSRGIDLFTGGFPCTGTSIAGKHNGLHHPESNLWYEYLRIIDEGRPKFAVIENPTGLLDGKLDLGMGEILQNLSEIGYMGEWTVLSARHFGSPQVRERVFIITHPPNGNRQRAECWADQLREVVERQKIQARYPSFERRGNVPYIRIPRELGKVNMFQPKGIAGRNDARRLFGRTIDLNCAITVIKRVLYLDRCFSK